MSPVAEKNTLQERISERAQIVDVPEPQTLEEPCASLEAERDRFLKLIEHLIRGRSQCYSGWSSVQQGADHRKLLQGDGNANVEKSGGASAEYGHGERYHYRLCQEGQVSTDQRRKFHVDLFPTNFSVFVATRELWPRGSTNYGNVCPGNSLINHTHMKDSDHLVTLAQEFRDKDQVCLLVVSCRAIGYLCVSSQNAQRSECGKAVGSKRMPVTTYLLIASDGSGGSRETPKSVRQVAFGVATFSLQPLSDTSFKLLRTGFLGGQVPGKRFQEPSFGEVPKSSAGSTRSRTSKFRLMRNT